MKNRNHRVTGFVENFLSRFGIGMRAKLILIFLFASVVPLILLTVIAWRQFTALGGELMGIAVGDSSSALNDSAVENIERLSTDTAGRVAEFLYDRDDDLLYLAGVEPTEENYRRFAESRTGRLVQTGEWALASDGLSWVRLDAEKPSAGGGISTNSENDDMDGFHYRQPDRFTYDDAPLYDEVAFVDRNGNELVKYVTPNSTKVRYPLSSQRRDVSRRENTYVRAESWFAGVQGLAPGEIYVSDVIGAYVGSNYIGMYTPENVAGAAADRGYEIEYDPGAQAYAGRENPDGARFEGIVRWATPVAGANGEVIGYVTFALNHDHIMEFVDHITPMNERYTELPSAFEGNYAFIWDYQCRSICHPRHHSIVGYDPETGDPQVPWLEASIYDAWQQSGVEKWNDFIAGWPVFEEQSRQKAPAPALTRSGLVGLDGRYLNNAPQCTGWMDLTQEGGSGSFYILWSGLYKLTTAAAIPYYTGQYAPSEQNDFSGRGFGFVAIGAGLEDFTRPARQTEERLRAAIGDNQTETVVKLMASASAILVLVVIIAIWIASYLTGNITRLLRGISRFRAGERQFRFRSTAKDEFGTLADSFDDMAESIVDSVKTPMSITDMEHNILYMNDYGLEICRKSLPDIVGAPYGENSVYPMGTVYDPILALEEGHEAEIYHLEYSDAYLKGSANYFLNKQGERIGYIIETADITDMVRKQLQIEEQRTLLDRIFSASPDLIWYMDAKGRYQAVNPRWAAIAGISVEEFIGKTAREVLPPALAGDFDRNDRAAIASSRPLNTEERVRFADGHEEILDAVRTPLYDAGGSLAGVLGYARNVSTRVDIENKLRSTQIELEQAVNYANQANRHKGEFLARMSHEIRTPMNAIMGVTNIVLGKLDSMGDENGMAEQAEVRGHIRQIEASSQHLLGLLNDILDISKIDAGKIDLSEEAVALSRLASTVVGIIKPRCEEKNIRFEVQLDDFSPDTFLTDPLRLRQVLINLLGNAVKFTPECGAIRLRISRLDRRDSKTLVEFSVRDTGIGISEEAQALIFQPFEQESGTISRQYGGTGLGLAISQRIVQLFGGKIELESKVDFGSDFRFRIWLRETESDLPDKREISNVVGKFAGKRMLLVDDVEINRIIVISMLEGTGIEIDEADDGNVAVRLFEESPESGYDIIFMDVQMPGMDGYEAAAAIRALNRPDARSVPIITLTANAFKDDIDKALKYGMNAHISKPVETDKMLEILFRFLFPDR